MPKCSILRNSALGCFPNPLALTLNVQQTTRRQVAWQAAAVPSNLMLHFA
jgi:hypothetical protein